jgi:hypothetical protein
MARAERIAAAALALGALLAAGPVRAGPYDGTQEIDIFQGPVFSSGRITGLAGAYVGLAEGQDGQPFNAASLAQRDRHLGRWLDVDFVLSSSLPGVGQVHDQDFDNDGRPDGALDSRSLSQLGLSLQIKRLGIGMLYRRMTLEATTPAGRKLSFTADELALGAAFGFWREQLVVGFEYAIGEALFAGPTPGDPTTQLSAGYVAFRPRMGLLYRPREERYRVGLSFDPGQDISLTVPALQDGLSLPRKVGYPTTLRVGGSAWLGPNGHLFNEPSPMARAEEYPLPPPVRTHASVQPVLVSFELDAFGTTPNGVTPTAWLLQGPGVDAARSGGGWSFSPHLGAEWEALKTWVVIRGGGYLEPSRVGAGTRAHGCFGFDVRVPLYLLDLRLSFAGDLASRYQNVALSLGLWHDPGPDTPLQTKPAS